MDFLSNDSWRICSTYHAVIKASPVAVTSEEDMLFYIPHVANLTKTGKHKQHHTDINITRENKRWTDLEYVIGGMILIKKMVSFAKLIPGTLTRTAYIRFIQIELLGFNVNKI